MPLTPVKHVPHDNKSFVIEIFSYENKCPRGVIRNPFFEKDILFHSTIDFLLAIERVFDSLSWPQATMASRRFTQKPKKSVWEQRTALEKPIAVMKLSVVFRQNASWQGALTWVEASEQVLFRSVLELLKLMDDALETQNRSVAAGQA